MMASTIPIHATYLVQRAQAVESRGAITAQGRLRSQSRPLSAHSHNAGITATYLGRLVSESYQRDCFVGFPLITAAASKQKKKVKDKKKSSWAENKQWKFDELMLVWDDVFSKACEDSSIATALWELSRNGLSKYGRGCVLMQETITTRPRGAASGFTFKSRSTDAPELPSYTSLQWVAEYVPKDFILDPSKASVSSSETPAASMEDGTIRVVDQGKLMSALRGMDRTRLLGLLADPESDDLKDPSVRDVGGEEPCDPSKDELVIMVLVLVDGQQAVGADVLKAFPTVGDGDSSNPASLWTLRLRDELAI